MFFFGAPALTIAAYLYGGAPLAALGEGTGLALNGWVNLVAAVILASFVPIVARQSRLLMVALATFAVAVGLLALLTLQPIDAQQTGAWLGVGRVAGWMIGVAGLMMLYLGIAVALLNGLGRVVLPIPGPIGGSADG